MNTPTPRTDILAKLDITTDGTWIAHSRTLERELTALTAERDKLRSRCDQLIESQRLAESAMQEQFARADKAKVELGLWQEGCIVREEDRAELATEREKVRKLRECLQNLLDEQNGDPLERRRTQWHITAAHRAEALLRVLGKWEDDK